MLHEQDASDNAYLAELSNELTTHAAGRSWRTDIGRNSYGTNVAFLRALAYSSGDGHSLGTGANRVCCILHVGTLKHLAVRQQQGASDSEV